MIQGAAIGLGALFMECNKVECPEVSGVWFCSCVRIEIVVRVC